MRIPRLSKSRYLAGCQCPLKLWYDCYERQLAPPPDLVQQAIFDTGHAVGRLAQQRYAGGQLVAFDYRHTKEAAPTVALKAAGHVLEYYHGRLPVCPQNSENADSASLS